MRQNSGLCHPKCFSTTVDYPRDIKIIIKALEIPRSDPICWRGGFLEKVGFHGFFSPHLQVKSETWGDPRYAVCLSNHQVRVVIGQASDGAAHLSKAGTLPYGQWTQEATVIDRPVTSLLTH